MTPTQTATLVYGAVLHLAGIVAVVLLLTTHTVTGTAAAGLLGLLGFLVGAPSGAALALITPGSASAPAVPPAPAP